jgi:hypothetical protein
VSVLILLAVLASAASAWSLWRRVRDALPHPAAAVPLSADRRRTVGGAALLGILAALAVVGDREPQATALAACLAWAVVSAWTALGAGGASGIDWSARVRRRAATALIIAALPVAVGTVLATEARFYGGGAFGLLAGWLVAGAIAPWIARLGADRDDAVAPRAESLLAEPDSSPFMDEDARFAGGWRGLDETPLTPDGVADGPPPLPRTVAPEPPPDDPFAPDPR